METAPVTAAAPLPNDGEAIELLKKIAAASEVQSSAAKWRRLSAQAVLICAAIIALAVAVLIPRAVKTLGGIDAATEELNSVAATLNQVDFVGMSESISELTEQGKDTLNTALGDVEASLDSMQTALDNISRLDVDGLNQSIADLSAIVDPMARLFGKK